MPRPSVIIATKVKPGIRLKTRRLYRRSKSSVFITSPRENLDLHSQRVGLTTKCIWTGHLASFQRQEVSGCGTTRVRERTNRLPHAERQSFQLRSKMNY